jgi:glutamate-ammonia-ligase adenylyltransferase
MSENIPANLKDFFLKQKAYIEESLNKLSLDWISLINRFEPKHPDLEKQLSKSVIFSDFIASSINHHPEIFISLLESGDFLSQRNKNYYIEYLKKIIPSIENEQQWMCELRKFREREMLRYIWREANSLTDLRQSMQEYSDFASAAIEISLSFLYEQHIKNHGVPRSREDKTQQQLAVLGMGKLGGNELNLSSDIDLIFFYQSGGETDGARPIENQLFFVRLAQQLIRVLDEQTADGRVFRVDMRLRPYGDSGLLVLNQNAMEHYYETQGRTWERYAFIKAAWVAGDRAVVEDFLKTIKPFIYRKYVDFTVVESLREMKLLINRQVKTRGLENDIKLGEGGIRELEFIVQALQLIKGGRKPSLQIKSYYLAMDEVQRLGLMEKEEYIRLTEIYSFYRRLEHLIQAQADQQTQLLPKDIKQQAALAWVMKFDSFSDLEKKIAESRTYVRDIFDELFTVQTDFANVNEKNTNAFDIEQYTTFWLRIKNEALVFKNLDQNLQDKINERVLSFHQEKILSTLSESEKKRLDSCMAYLLFRISEYENPDELIEKTIQFLRVILKRSAYLVLLIENPPVFDYLLSLFQRSQWVLTNILQHPFLLDELLQIQNNKNIVSKVDLFDELHQLSLRTDGHDLETQLEELRVYKCTHEMRAAALYLDNHLSTSDLGDFLSALAEGLLLEVHRLALKVLSDTSLSAKEIEFANKGFAIVAYGKLGSQELGFGSDLDLVFLFDEKNKNIEEPGRFLTRFGQKIIHLLSVRTYSGILYEVDMRLRPSGQSGQLVTSLTAFEKYQRESAWTWEHQALIKARVLVGGDLMKSRFNEIRKEILLRQREPMQLFKDINDMRIRLHENSPRSKDLFYLKTDDGGIVDIEFLTQYLVLGQSAHFPELVNAHACLEIFKFADQHTELRPEWMKGLKEIYLLFRRQINQLTLAQHKVVLAHTDFKSERNQVIEIWQKLVIDHGFVIDASNKK